jgi:hypothetical protein
MQMITISKADSNSPPIIPTVPEEASSYRTSEVLFLINSLIR